MPKKGHTCKTACKKSHQKGYTLAVAIVFALILSLVAAGVAKKVWSQNDAVMGLSLRQAAGVGGDRALALAAQWLNANAGSLTADNSAAGFYATETKGLDWTGLITPNNPNDDVDWDGTNNATTLKAFAVPGVDSAGNSLSYVIQRLCGSAGAYTATSGVQCMTYVNSSIPSTYKSGMLYNAASITTSTMIYYRITARTLGPKGAVSYTQALVLINS